MVNDLFGFLAPIKVRNMKQRRYEHKCVESLLSQLNIYDGDWRRLELLMLSFVVGDVIGNLSFGVNLFFTFFYNNNFQFPRKAPSKPNKN